MKPRKPHNLIGEVTWEGRGEQGEGAGTLII